MKKDRLLKNTLVKGSRLGCFIKDIKPWVLVEDKSRVPLKFKLIKEESEVQIDPMHINQIKTKKGLIWGCLNIQCGDFDLELPGIYRWGIETAKSNLENIISNTLVDIANNLLTDSEKLSSDVDRFFERDTYIRQSYISSFSNDFLKDINAFEEQLSHFRNNEIIKKLDQYKQIASCLKKIKKDLEPSSKRLKDRNDAYIQSELKRYKGFFDRVEKLPLTEEQRISVVAFEDRNLLVAAAGSGKSSTLIGKVGYALHKGMFKAHEIVALAFNKDASDELNQRVEERLKPILGNTKVEAKTFHALGKSIITETAENPGEFIDVVADGEYKFRLRRALEKCLPDYEFQINWMTFLSLCKDPKPNDDSFESLEEYENYVEFQRRARRDGAAASFQALSGDVVRSYEELTIANWLYMWSVPFEYEKSFEPKPESWRKFQPDFYYPEINVWHEHFALDDKGVAPKIFGDYAKTAQLKRELFDEHIPDSWFETRSGDQRAGKLTEKLEFFLRKYGQKLSLRDPKEVLEKIKSLRQSDPLDLIGGIITLVKVNEINKSEYRNKLLALDDKQRSLSFIKVFWPIYAAYNQSLVDDKKIDFSDMIISATKKLQAREYLSPYKLILVDEFQDLSQDRARLIQALLSQHNDSVLFGVGDDWQAINGFAGSDLKLFMHFEDKFGPTFQYKLTNTFRCSQGISDVASFFIQENKNGQIQKKVVSQLDSTVNETVELVSFYGDSGLASELVLRLEALAEEQRLKQQEELHDKKAVVYLLSRYGIKKTRGISERWLNDTGKRFADCLDLKFMTIHKSKGLEADYVFILRVNAKKGYTFPSTMPKEPLKEVLLTNQDSFPHADERRLLYVAITRAKKKATILYEYGNSSPFVTELLGDKYKNRVKISSKVSSGAKNYDGRPKKRGTKYEYS